MSKKLKFFVIFCIISFIFLWCLSFLVFLFNKVIWQECWGLLVLGYLYFSIRFFEKYDKNVNK